MQLAMVKSFKADVLNISPLVFLRQSKGWRANSSKKLAFKLFMANILHYKLSW